MALARKRGSGPPARRDPRSLVGLGVQALGFSLCFAVQRPPGRAPGAVESILCLLVGTGLNVTRWPALVGGVALYLVGTHLRTRVEEGLLLQRFGDEYAGYAAQVPALLPWPFTRSRRL